MPNSISETHEGRSLILSPRGLATYLHNLHNRFTGENSITETALRISLYLISFVRNQYSTPSIINQTFFFQKQILIFDQNEIPNSNIQIQNILTETYNLHNVQSKIKKNFQSFLFARFFIAKHSD